MNPVRRIGLWPPRYGALRGMLLIVLAAVLASCGDMIWTSSGHPASTPGEIQILVKTPSHYERLGTVTHLYTPGTPWKDGDDATPILRDLLTESGTMGANALLLVDDTTMADASITMTFQGRNYTLPVIARTRTVLAQAIFVAGR